MSTPTRHAMPLNLATCLTLGRIVMIPVLVVLFYAPWEWTHRAAAMVFLAAALTDWLDGWVARRYGMYSDFGAFLDPVADKLAVTTALFVIVQSHPTILMALLAAVIVGREITISALREWMAEIGERGTVKVAWVGKIKTIVQMLALIALLYREPWQGINVQLVGEILLAIAAVLTLWSGIAYLRAAWPAMRR